MPTDSVSRMNQIVLLLRQQLGARAGRSGAAGAAARTAPPKRGHSQDAPRTQGAFVQVLRDAGVTSTALLQRALIERLLLGGLGEHLLNETPFQALVDDVLAALLADPAMAQLLDAAIQRQTPGSPTPTRKRQTTGDAT